MAAQVKIRLFFSATSGLKMLRRRPALRQQPGKRLGDNVEFKDADITDWMFLRNGKIVGGETIRPMLKLMTKADADALRARLEAP